jgi:Zn-dependent protease
MFLKTLITDPIFFLSVIIILIISISLHELAHGVAALSQGDDTPKRTGHMTLNPVVHMGVPSLIFLCVAGITWGAMPVNPAKFRSPKWGNIIVSAAGPLLNLTLGILCILFIKISLYSDWDEAIGLEFFKLAAIVNLSLFLFNLLPIPPLDGFHVFSEIFTPLKPLKDSPYGLLILMLVFMNPQFGRGLSMGSGLLFATLQNSAIWLSVAGGLIVVAIVFSLIASKISTQSDPQRRS